MIPSDAQLHLALTHLPVSGVLFGTAFLLLGAGLRSPSARRFGLALVIFSGVAVFPTYWTGEGAEEIVEDRSGVSEAAIERHEEAAEVALVLTLAAAAVAGASFVASGLSRARLATALFGLACLTSVVDSAALAWVAHLGGQVRHDEIRPIAGARPDRAHRASRTRHDD